MIVREATLADSAAIDRFAAAHPAGTIFHTTAWRAQVLDAAPHEPYYLVVDAGEGAIRGLLPLFHVRSLLGGETLVSVPYAVYGGILASDDAVASALLTAARDLADRLGVRHFELRQLDGCSPIASEGIPLATSPLYVTFLRDLPNDPEECLTIIPRKSRATTRHARDKHGMEFVEGRHLLPRFHELFLENKTALGSPSFSRGFFENLLWRLGDRVWLNGVSMNGEIIAACISFAHASTLNPYYSGSLPGTERLGSMNFMYWQLMELAVKRGFTRYDFGRSRVDTGAFAFKKNMGFEPTPLHYQFYLRGGSTLPSLNPSNPKFERFQSLWRKLPLPILDVAGPWMMRHLP